MRCIYCNEIVEEAIGEDALRVWHNECEEEFHKIMKPEDQLPKPKKTKTLSCILCGHTHECNLGVEKE